MSNQKHLLIIEDDSGSRQLVLDAPVYSIGRDRECNIRLASFFVSRHHATLVRVLDEGEQSYYHIVDGTPNGEPSVNGLRVNGQAMRSHSLQNEDKVVLGPRVQLTYYLLQHDQPITEPTGEFDDVTLINPGTVEEGSIIDPHLSPLIRYAIDPHLPPLIRYAKRGNLVGQIGRFFNFRRGNLRLRQKRA